MPELYDILQNNSFNCPKCGANLTSEWLIAAAAEYGVIQLTGEKDGFIGWSCPGCSGLSTNFIRLEIESFNVTCHELRKALTSARLRDLCYHSFPYRYDLRDSDYYRRAGRVLLAEYEIMHEWRLEYEETKFDPALKYCSYDFSSNALGPIVYVWWYDGSQIESMMRRENETGLKLFPRYIIHHSKYSIINKFCWDHRIHLEELKSLNQSILAFFRTPANRTPKAVGFLILLDTVNDHRLSAYPMLNIIPFAAPRIKEYDNGPIIISPDEKKEMLNELFLHKNLWEIINEEWIQRLINDLAENYISDYLSLLAKNDCNYSSIETLNYLYLRSLYEALTSLNKQSEIRARAKADLRNRAIQAEKTFPNLQIVSESNAIDEIKIQISKLASSKLADTFLISGERGTGKEIFAKAIHEASKPKGRLIKVDCGAITETLFESEIFGHIKSSFTGADRDRRGALEEAKGGSVFFDEIGNLPLNLQPKLLRVLQDRKYVPVGSSIERPIDSKFIFATNKDLDEMVRKGLFMPDLYDRLNVFKFPIPPLRDRKEDIPLLIDHFIRKFGYSHGLDFGNLRVAHDFIKNLKSLDWKGNVRTLENAIKEIVARRIATQNRSEIRVDDLPTFITMSEETILSKPKKKLPGNTKITDQQLIECLKTCDNNKTSAAKKLGVDPCTIHRRIKKINESSNPT